MRKVCGSMAVIAALVVMVAMPTFASEVVRPEKVLRPTAFAVTPPMRDFVAPEPTEKGIANFEIPNKPATEFPTLPGAVPADRVMGEGFISPDSGILAPAPDIGFDGNNSDDNNDLFGFRLAPPDTQGAVGMQYYVQWVNLTWSVYDKMTGAEVMGPLPGNSLFQSLPPGSACAVTNDGDPITLYDHEAGRWFMSQFAITGPNYACLAVSVTGDPTGSWYVWEYNYGGPMNDYPKFGIWPDGYYMTVNEFGSGESAETVFDRTAMLAGDATPAAQYFYIEGVQPAFPQPTNWDGGPPPPMGSPNYNAAFYDDAWGNPVDAIQVCDLTIDWATPANSAFTCPVGPGDPGYLDLTAIGLSFDSSLCAVGGRDCIPQPSGQYVDSLSNRFMFPMNYRNLMATLGYEVMTVTHSVDVDGSNWGGVRWYELRNTGAGWYVHDGGTFAPDSDHRWMGSSAVDMNGNIGLIYSISSDTTFPSVGYTARAAGDPAGTMQTEQVLAAGSGSQEGVNRWGDYAAMHVDPDGCTFWGTAEYVNAGGSWQWDTYIGAFTMPGCTPGGFGTLDGMVYNGVTMDPIGGAQVMADGYTAFTQPDGTYAMNLPEGTYDVTASAFGFDPNMAMGVVITEGMPTTQDFALTPVGNAYLDGYVTDMGHGWPLYAKIEIATGGMPVGAVFTDPFTGYYMVELPVGTPYDLNVMPMFPGYWGDMRGIVLNVMGQTESFMLGPMTPACYAPGYAPGMGVRLDEQFEGGFPPPDWTVTNMGGNCVWVGDDPGGRGNLTGGSGGFAIADSDACGIGTMMDTHMYTPIIWTGGMAQMVFEFKHDYNNLSSSEVAAVDIRFGNGLPPAVVPDFPMDAPGEPTSAPDHWNDSDARAAVLPEREPAAPLAAGDVIQSWGSGLAATWTLAFHQGTGNPWVGEGWGNDTIYEYMPGGGQTGTSHVAPWAPLNGPADATFDRNTGMLWVLDVGADNCIHELDPATGYTGGTICPGFGISQRGLAFDPVTDTFFAGGWNDYTVYRFDRGGTILQTANVGLAIAGLAFNPGTQHLFAIENSATDAVTVLDVNDNYNALGSFTIPGMGSNGGAGLGIDCDGDLWVVNQLTETVLEVDSGEPGFCENTWINLVTWNTDERGPATFTKDVTGLVGSYDEVQFRFRYYAPGWDWWFEVDDVRFFDPTAPCQPVPGAMAEGFVTDANTSDGLNGAEVMNDVGGMAMTMPTPDDPAIGDGFYYLFTPLPTAPSSNTFTASAANYADSVVGVVLSPEAVNQIDFALAAGWLELTPYHLDSRLGIGGNESQMMELINYGGLEANFMLLPIESAPWVPSSPMDQIAVADVPAGHINDFTAEAGTQPDAPQAAPLAAGDVLSSFPTGLALPWGLGFDKFGNLVWASNPGAGGGDNLDHEYNTGGTATGKTYDTSAWMGDWAGDMAFDPMAGTMWQMAVGGDNCIHEWDPATATTTGGVICWGAATSERGVAYDPVSDTFFIGGWNTDAVTRFDRAGAVLQVANVGLSISGLAYNPISELLYVMTNAAPNLVHVLDPNDNYNQVGSFGVAGFGDYSGAGLGFSCDGHLWATNQTDGMIYEIDSGESGACLGGGGLPWLELTPNEGVAPPMGPTSIDAMFMADGADHFGLHQAMISVIHDTPYDVNQTSVCFTKAFSDVPVGYWADEFIHSVAGARITGGCGGPNFCPDDLMTRSVMARWLINSMFGPDYSPPPCVGIFADVICETTPNSDYIEALYNEGITGGCGLDPLIYCPDDPVTREQMAVFLLGASEGVDYVPPACTGVFADVACPTDWSVDWVEDLYIRGITGGCATGPLRYCPDSPVTRGEMAVFETATFDLPRCDD